MTDIQSDVQEAVPIESPGGSEGKELGGFATFVLVMAGVLWPALTIAIEVASGWCADEFLDPIPTWPHLLLVCLVPCGNAYALMAVKGQPRRGRLSLATFLIGASSAVSLVYAVVFLPLLPIALIAVIFAGIGLLPLTPFAAVLANLGLALAVTPPAARAGGKPALWLPLGMGTVFALLLGMELPIVAILDASRKASSSDPSIELASVKSLRQSGNLALLRQLCGLESGRTPGLAASIARGVPSFDGPRSELTTREDRLRVYYRVTGEDPTRIDVESEMGGLWRPWRSDMPVSGLFDDFDVEPDWLRGTTTVGPVSRNLALEGSRLDGIVDGEAALAYLEWTLTFGNVADFPSEARARINLPRGGVVSRLTLWIHGEEREAAFASREKTSRAYNEVVARRKDPALVTTDGVDAVLLRCFPVPPQSTLQVRVGLTLPLQLGESTSEGTPLTMELPSFVEHNFQLPERHSVWLESHSPLVAFDSDLQLEHLGDGTWALRGDGVKCGPSSAGSTITCIAPSALPSSWSEDYTSEGVHVLQSFALETLPPPAISVFVIDGSSPMGAQRQDMLAMLDALDASLESVFVFALEEESRVVEDRVLARKVLEELEFQGGLDNGPALEKAWDLAATTPGARIFWLHGPQPVRLAKAQTQGLLQRFERRPNAAGITSCQLIEGVNTFTSELARVPFGHFMRLRGADPLELFAGLHVPREVLARKLERVEDGSEGEHRSSTHLARLWAHERILELGTAGREVAQEMASSYRLVTPLSGAVVLETEAQYERNDLDPIAPPGAVPTVPEPRTWFLILVALAALWMTGRKRLGRNTV